MNPVSTENFDALLDRSCFGRVRHVLALADSTNRIARDLGDAGAPEGTVVIADQQTAGRGRLGRTWFSPAGVNLYLSLLLRPDAAPASIPQLAIVMGLAAAHAVLDVAAAAPVRVKWPNDIFLGAAKAGGVLCEATVRGTTVPFVVAGIGLNVNLTAAQLPAELRERATSLRIVLGHDTDRALLAAAVCRRAEAFYGHWRQAGLAPLVPTWNALCLFQHGTIQVRTPTELLSGTAGGISAAGELLLQTDDGRWRRIRSGEVSQVRACRRAST